MYTVRLVRGAQRAFEATEELLAIPGFLEAFRKAKQEEAEGKLTNFDNISWKA